MSASREKQLRQEQTTPESIEQKAALEAEQRSKEKRSNLLYGILAAAFVVAIAVTLLWRSNLIQKNATAVTVDGEKYSAAEVSFYYQNAYLTFMNNASYYISYLGLDTSASLKSQTISETAAGMTEMLGLQTATAGQTWYDYFLDQALKQMTAAQNATKAADAEGFVYPDSVEMQYTETLSALQENAAANGISTDEYLTNMFGTLMTEKVYSEHLMRMLKFSAYSTAFMDKQEYSDSELEAIYKENPNSYDVVSYEAIAVNSAAESTKDADGNTVEPTEEEIAAAKEAAQKAADAILADFKAGKKLESLEDVYENTTYNKSESSPYTGGDVMDWLFDFSRKTGDCTVMESGNYQYVLVFQDRYREEYNTVDIRHILIQPEAGTLTSEDEDYEAEQEQLNAEAKAIADDLLAQWKAGEATEDSFAALAKEHSVDGSKYEGGLYTQVYQGQMVEEFENWCFDPTRKPGDTGVVETTYGYHVMYFVGENAPYWQLPILSTKLNEAYLAWVEDLYTASTPQQNSFGMKFVG